MNIVKAKKIEKKLSIHNHIRIDPYYWLNDRENPEVIDYLNKENEYTESILTPHKALRENLFTEITSRIKQTDMSVPYKHNGYFYYVRYEEGQEYPLYCRKKETLENKEELMLDVNILAKDHTYCEVGDIDISTNNQLLAYSIDVVGRRQYNIYIKNLETGELYSDKIVNVTEEVVWANDNKTLFYSEKDDALRSYKIHKHFLGTSKDYDVEVFHEKDETFSVFVYKTKSERFIMIGSRSTLSSEYRYIEANKPNDTFTIIHPREHELEYEVDHFGDSFFVLTNYLAKNFRLMQCSIERCSKEFWLEVIPHREDVLLESIEIFKDFMVVEERFKGLVNIRVMNQKSKEDYYIQFNDPAYLAYVSTNPEYDTDVLRFGYTSLTLPNSVYDYNMHTKERVLLKQQEVVGGYNAADYESERLFAKASDGALIPISIVYKKGMKRDGSNPLLLYGYGSYGHTVDATFSSPRLSLLDRGFAFAIAHIRGGEDMGRYWYEDGKMLKKKNTFTDFIACAEFLIEEKYTSPNTLFAMGGSAGGLLMGAVVNIRPDLFKGIIAAVPFVDVVTTMLDDTIPLTTGEYDEWGNPNNKEYYDYMLSYSPYDNVDAKAYPAMLVTTGLHDSQVQYWEPAKWVAKLRDVKTDNNVLLLQTNMDAGHGGASGRFEQYKETALNYTFLLSLVEAK